MDIRPTTDKVKESMFSILQFDIEGRRVLDLFGGTGQLGIEALSRGASEVVFVDKSAAALKLIRENLEDMHKVVAYLLEKETITGGEMVAIIQGRDPALVEDAYASTHGRSRSLTGDIEPPAKNIHIVSEPVSAPQLPDGEPEQSGPEEPPAQPRDDETPPPQDGEGPNEKPEQDRP